MKNSAVAGLPPVLSPAVPESVSRFFSTFLPVLGWSVLAVGAHLAAYSWDAARPLIAVYLFALIRLAHQDRWRLAFYPALLVGFCVGMVQLNFFYTIFSVGAPALWLVFAIWIALFVALARLCLRRFGGAWGLALVPFLWVGLEYFRSELYYLRFAWLTPGFTFAEPVWTPAFKYLGVYGTSLVVAGLVCLGQAFSRRRPGEAGLIVVMASLMILPHVGKDRGEPGVVKKVKVAGVQMEFPTETEVMLRLRELLSRAPDAELVVLPEYTFQETVPARVRDWCRRHAKYLVVGGKEPAGSGDFYNTTFVVSPEGEVIFKQAKSVPIQFFKDGLPAPTLRLWESPWGRIGIPICYDLSYSRVTDALVGQGAQALLVPTMDVADWGIAQHRLHARVAPVRAAEYGIPVFRLASSGISQLVNRRGKVEAEAPCLGDGAVILGEMQLAGAGQVPPLRWLAPVSTGITFLLGTAFAGNALRGWWRGRRVVTASPTPGA